SANATRATGAGLPGSPRLKWRSQRRAALGGDRQFPPQVVPRSGCCYGEEAAAVRVSKAEFERVRLAWPTGPRAGSPMNSAAVPFGPMLTDVTWGRITPRTKTAAPRIANRGGEQRPWEAQLVGLKPTTIARPSGAGV